MHPSSANFLLGDGSRPLPQVVDLHEDVLGQLGTRANGEGHLVR